MINSPDISNNLSISSQSLDRLRAQAKQSPEQALKAAAQQFEAVFMNMMLKSMRDATPQDSMFDSEQTKMYTGMLDQQLAQNLSNRGIGLADIMIKQLGRSINPEVVNGTVMSKSLQDEDVKLQQNFVQRFAPPAAQASRESGVPLRLMLGQAALESGWGQREIRMADGSNSYNLFGIKASGNWNGKVAEVMTTEYQAGVAKKQVEKFRAYSSYAEAFEDYAHLLRDNPRYSKVAQQGLSVLDSANALQLAGYATDPAYADKLVGIMNRINTFL